MHQVLNSPFDATQFSIAGAQNDAEREFVLKAANQGASPAVHCMQPPCAASHSSLLLTRACSGA